LCPAGGQSNSAQKDFANREKLSRLRITSLGVQLSRDGTKKIFGTDGVRGVANVEPVTAETALNLAGCGVCVRAFRRKTAHSISTRPKKSIARHLQRRTATDRRGQSSHQPRARFTENHEMNLAKARTEL